MIIARLALVQSFVHITTTPSSITGIACRIASIVLHRYWMGIAHMQGRWASAVGDWLNSSIGEEIGLGLELFGSGCGHGNVFVHGSLLRVWEIVRICKRAL